MKSLNARVMLVLMLMLTLTFASPLALYATSLDELQSEGTVAQDGSQGQQSAPVEETYTYPEENSYGGALTDYMKGYTPITAENMAVASETMSPIVSFMGTLSGAIMTFALAGIFVVTATDLVYIGIPITRSILNPNYMDGGASGGGAMTAGGMPMAGGYNGYGRGGYGAGMMPMAGNMQGAAPQPHRFGFSRCVVSDEAVYCVNTYSLSSGAQAQAQNPMAGGMMPGMPNMQPQQPATSGKQAIGVYLRKRLIFVILFAVCSVILMSSVLLDCGINLAELGMRVLEKLNGKIATTTI